MRTAAVFLLVITISWAAQLRDREVIPILNQFREINYDGTYRSGYQTANGISAQEEGYVKNAGNKDTESGQVQGGYEYTAPDGTVVHMTYIANEFGFQPQGSHLPVAPVDTNTPPPIPLAILKSLEYNAAHPEEDDESNRHFQPPNKY